MNRSGVDIRAMPILVDKGSAAHRQNTAIRVRRARLARSTIGGAPVRVVGSRRGHSEESGMGLDAGGGVAGRPEAGSPLDRTAEKNP